MKKIILLFILCFCVLGKAQVGIGTKNILPSVMLQLESADKALLLPRVSSVNNIPKIPTGALVNGMLIYDATLKCVRAYEDNAWSDCFGAAGSGSGSQVQAVYADVTSAGNGFQGGVSIYKQGIQCVGTHIFQVTIFNKTYSDVIIPVTTSDLTLSGPGAGSNLSVSAVVNTSGIQVAGNLTISAGSSLVLRYRLSGTLWSGDLNGDWSIKTLSGNNSVLCESIASYDVKGFGGTQNYDAVALTGNTNYYRVDVTNTTTGSVTIPVATSNLVLSGVSGLSVAKVVAGLGNLTTANITSVTIAPGATQSILYVLSGKATNAGTLTGTLNLAGFVKNEVKTINIIDKGLVVNSSNLTGGSYVQGGAPGTYVISITNKSFGSKSVTPVLTYISTNGGGIFNAPGGNIGVSTSSGGSNSLASGDTTTLNYNLTGAFGGGDTIINWVDTVNTLSATFTQTTTLAVQAAVLGFNGVYDATNIVADNNHYYAVTLSNKTASAITISGLGSSNLALTTTPINAKGSLAVSRVSLTPGGVSITSTGPIPANGSVTLYYQITGQAANKGVLNGAILIPGYANESKTVQIVDNGAIIVDVTGPGTGFVKTGDYIQGNTGVGTFVVKVTNNNSFARTLPTAATTDLVFTNALGGTLGVASVGSTGSLAIGQTQTITYTLNGVFGAGNTVATWKKTPYFSAGGTTDLDTELSNSISKNALATNITGADFGGFISTTQTSTVTSNNSSYYQVTITNPSATTTLNMNLSATDVSLYGTTGFAIGSSIRRDVPSGTSITSVSIPANSSVNLYYNVYRLTSPAPVAGSILNAKFVAPGFADCGITSITVKP